MIYYKVKIILYVNILSNMYKCKCGLSIDKTKYPNHKTSKRHYHFLRKTIIHPFLIQENNNIII